MRSKTGRTKVCTVQRIQNIETQEMATKIDKNVFSSPWNDSDMVLVVEDQELHVHRLILTLLSPVFKAMLDGHFKEASEDKITLEGKSPLDGSFSKITLPIVHVWRIEAIFKRRYTVVSNGACRRISMCESY